MVQALTSSTQSTVHCNDVLKLSMEYLGKFSEISPLSKIATSFEALCSKAMSDSDAERQADEIDSLKWIYPHELVVTSDSKPISGYFKISPHLIEDEMIIQIETIINSQTENSNISIRHLSPIELYFTLPVNYPSESQPLFMVNCVWLSHEKLTNVCRKLDDLWDKNFGCEILFLWVSFLKDDLLQFLSVNGLAITLDMDSKKLSSNENTADTSTLYDVDQKDIKLRALTNKTVAVEDEKENISASTTSSDIAKRSNRKSKRHSEHNNFKYETPKDIKEKMIGESSTVETSSKQVCEERCRPVASKAEHILRAISTFGRRPKMTLDEFDSRVVPNTGEQANILNSLIDYNEHCLDIEFRSQTHVCDICFEEKPGWQCVCVRSCRHAFCKNCVTNYLTVNIQSGLVQKLSCMNFDCDTLFTRQQVKQNVDDATFTKYLKFSQKSMVQNDAKLAFCPRKFCQGVAQVSDGREMCHCRQCNFYFCYYCRKTYHGVDMCKIQSDEISKVIEEYQTANIARKTELEKRFGKSQLTRWVQENMTEKVLKEVCRPCPNCSALIQKDEGCNKMLCTSCSVPFCWLCGTSLSTTHPYAHYQNRTSPCFEKLFSFMDDDYFDFEEDADDFDIIFVDGLYE